jgi:autotransporter-associated beta strand protein
MKMKSPRLAAVAGLVIVVVIPAVAAQQVLHGHVPEVVGRLHLRPVGRLPGTNQLNLTIGLPLRNREALTNLLEQLYDPASSTYHHYLTPQQFTERFGPAEKDYRAVVNFAETSGLEVVATHDSRMLLDVRGKASDIEAAFHVTLQTYQHPTEPRIFYAPDIEPSVASNLPIQEINGISDYAILHPMGRIEPIAKKNGTASGSSPNGGYYMGKDFRNAYATGVSLKGNGQIIGLFEADGYYTSDITNYEAEAGLTNVPLQTVLVDGFSGTPGVNNYEVALDIELAISMAPGLSAVVVFESPNNTFDWLDVLDDMATNTQIKQFSSSWGYTGGENPNPQFDSEFEKMAMQGQSFFQASGDGDAWTNPIWVPADSPYITSVGGTTLTMNGSGVSYASETVWNSGYYSSAGLTGPWFANGNGYWGSGGGVSGSYTIPYWQQGINMTTNHGSTAFRNIPDVAVVANGIYVIYNNGSSDWFVGTSCAAPLWAGFNALVNQQAANYYQPPVGFINPAIYNIGKGASYTSCFHDITTGTNTWPGSPTNFFAVTGYDLCTGWGSPNGPNLIYALTSTGTQNLFWRGNGLTNTWNTTNANWFNGTNLVTYQSGDTVTFDDTGSNNPAINLAGVLVPATMTVSATQSYILSGSGYLNGGMTLTKSGAGTLTLAEANTYSGGTTVSNGALLVNNTSGSATGTGAVTIGNGGMLGGTGIISGAVTVNSGGVLAPGNPFGTMTISNNLTLVSGSTMFVQILHSPSTNGTIKVSGTIGEAGTFDVTNISSGNLAAGDTFKIINATNYSGAFAGVILPTLPAGLGWNTAALITHGSLSIVVTAKPAIRQIAISSMGVAFNGNGGVANANYYLLASTNIITPLSNWTRILTNQFDNGGGFNFTNPDDPKVPQSFYLLQLQ